MDVLFIAITVLSFLTFPEDDDTANILKNINLIIIAGSNIFFFLTVFLNPGIYSEDDMDSEI